MHGILQIKRLDEFGNVGGVGIHVVPIDRLRGTAVPAAIMGDYPITVVQKEHHLRVPVVCGERPAMVEEERLTCAPILKVNLRAVFHCDRVHGISFGFVSWVFAAAKNVWAIRGCGIFACA